MHKHKVSLAFCHPSAAPITYYPSRLRSFQRLNIRTIIHQEVKKVTHLLSKELPGWGAQRRLLSSWQTWVLDRFHSQTALWVFQHTELRWVSVSLWEQVHVYIYIYACTKSKNPDDEIRLVEKVIRRRCCPWVVSVRMSSVQHEGHRYRAKMSVTACIVLIKEMNCTLANPLA